MRNPEQKPNYPSSESQSSEHRLEAFSLPSSFSNLAQEIHDEIGEFFEEGIDLDRHLKQLEFFFRDFREFAASSGDPNALQGISSQEVHVIHALTDFVDSYEHLRLPSTPILNQNQARSLSNIRASIDPGLKRSLSGFTDRIDSSLKPLSDGISEGGAHFLMGKDFQYVESAAAYFETFLREAFSGFDSLSPALMKEAQGEIVGVGQSILIDKMNEESVQQAGKRGKFEAIAHHQIAQSLYDEFISELGQGSDSKLKEKLIHLIGLNLKGMQSGLAGQTLNIFDFDKKANPPRRFLSHMKPLSQLEFLLAVVNVGMGFQHNLHLQRDLLDPKRSK